jgi:hypothetical protein
VIGAAPLRHHAAPVQRLRVHEPVQYQGVLLTSASPLSQLSTGKRALQPAARAWILCASWSGDTSGSGGQSYSARRSRLAAPTSLGRQDGVVVSQFSLSEISEARLPPLSTAAQHGGRNHERHHGPPDHRCGPRVDDIPGRRARGAQGAVGDSAGLHPPVMVGRGQAGSRLLPGRPGR